LSAFCSTFGQTVAPAPKPGTPQNPAPPVALSPPSITLQETKKGRATQALAGNLAVNGSVYRTTTSADAIPPLVIQFSSTNEALIQDWEEDLSVMTQIIEQSLQRAAEEDLADFKISRVLISGNRSVRPLYLEGFGALFMIKVNFPVVPPTKIDEEKTDRSESEWDKARHELYRRRQASWMAGNVESGADYDSDQVDTLKKELIQALKNASNFRHLKSDEYISITVFGSPNSGAKAPKGSSRRKKTNPVEDVAKEVDRAVRDQLTPQRAARPGTVLTLRVRKSEVDAFAKGIMDYEAFEKKIATNSYLGNGYGITSLNSWIRSAIQEIPFGR